MKMKLEQLEKMINPIIVQRGVQYREQDCILSLEEVESGVYCAEVEGTDYYQVGVQLDGQGHVTDTECDCPYDQGPICKHVVAVLLEIREEWNNKHKEKSPTVSDDPYTPNPTLADQLAKLSKEDLIKLIMKLSTDCQGVEQSLALELVEVGETKELTPYMNMIRASIKDNSDQYGFVPYRNVSYAIEGAERVYGKAEDLGEQGHYLQAAELHFCIVHEMGNLMQSCDDSDGIVGNMIEVCLSEIHTIAKKFNSSSEQDRLVLFQRLLHETLHPNLEGWSEWKLPLLEGASFLMKSIEERDQWSTIAGQLEKDETRHSYSSYLIEQLAMIRYRVMKRIDGEGAAWTFLQDNLDLAEFRKLAIEYAIEQQQYDAALQLVEEGERKDTIKGLPGLVDHWKKIRCELYGLTHRVKDQIQLAEQFTLSGEREYYLLLKRLYGQEQWIIERERILNELEQLIGRDWRAAAMYKELLVEEQETQRLLRYVQAHIDTVPEYYTYLVSNYAEEVYSLFIQLISNQAESSSNRKQYQQVCGIIRHLMKAGGGIQAKKAIEQLNMTYYNRPAFKDELSKIKIN